MKLHFIDLPQYRSVDLYAASINRMRDFLMSLPEIVSIYQVGSISVPGISDVDFVVVFRDHASLNVNPVQLRHHLSDRYYFIHSLFGTTESRLAEIETFTLFGNYHWLAGKQFEFKPVFENPDEQTLIEKQLALEYLLKAFISLHSNVELRIIKVRSLLLHAKSLVTDLRFLGAENGRFAGLLNEMVSIRNNWFEHTPDFKNLSDVVIEFHKAFGQALADFFSQFEFYAPHPFPVAISQNHILQNAKQFRTERTGIRIPGWFPLCGNLNFRVQNKLNRFIFALPVNTGHVPPILKKRFDYIKTGIEYNRRYLPGFLCTAYPLNFFTPS